MSSSQSAELAYILYNDQKPVTKSGHGPAGSGGSRRGHTKGAAELLTHCDRRETTETMQHDVCTLPSPPNTVDSLPAQASSCWIRIRASGWSTAPPTSHRCERKGGTLTPPAARSRDRTSSASPSRWSAFRPSVRLGGGRVRAKVVSSKGQVILKSSLSFEHSTKTLHRFFEEEFTGSFENPPVSEFKGTVCHNTATLWCLFQTHYQPL